MKVTYAAIKVFLPALLGVAGVALYAQEVQVSAANRTIEVTVTDLAERRADAAVLHIGYQVYGATSDEAYGKGAALSREVTTALDQLGISKDAVESTSQGTGPVEAYANNGLALHEAEQRKFQAQQGWSVHASPDTVAKILAAAVGAGANQSGNIDWSLADDGVLSAEAAAKALKHARVIAEQMATGLGVRLGPLVYASNQAEQLQRFAKLQASSAPMAASRQVTPELRLGPPLQRSSATVRAVFSIQ